jgi:hypothetical protein
LLAFLKKEAIGFKIMQELETVKARAIISQVRLRLEKTDVPWDYWPKGEKGERLTFPTSARLSIAEEKLRIEMIVQDPEERNNEYYREPDFDDDAPPIIYLQFPKGEILHLMIGGHLYRGQNPTAVLVIVDPGEVIASLSLTFASYDSNNPRYPVLALAKMLRERLGVTIEDAPPEPERRMF